VAEIILMMLLWSLGIDGMNVVSSMAYPFWMTQLTANANHRTMPKATVELVYSGLRLFNPPTFFQNRQVPKDGFMLSARTGK